MKTIPVTAPLACICRTRRPTRLSARRWTALLAAYLAAALGIAAILILATWASGNGMQDILAGTSWGAGLVFLALAIDSEGPGAMLQAVSGLVLMVLAWATYRVAPEFAVLAALLVSAWLLGVFFAPARG